MKVLHVLYQSLPDLSGSSVRSHQILRSELSVGIDAAAITSPFQPAMSEGRTADGADLIQGVRYWRSSSPRRNLRIDESAKALSVRLAKVGMLPRFCTELWRLCGKARPDLLHAHATAFSAVAALVVGRIRKIPAIYEIRSFYFWGDRRGRREALVAKAVEIAERRACRAASAVVVISGGMEQELRARWKLHCPILVVPNAIWPLDITPVRPFGEGRTGRSLVLGYVGTFSSYEGLVNLVDAMQLLRSAGWSNRLLLFGRGALSEALEARIGSARIEGVELRGPLPRERIHEAYAEVDIVINPRQETAVTKVVTPMKPLEAMAYGRLFVGAQVGGISELTRGGVGCVLRDLSTPEKIASVLRILLRTPVCELAKRAEEGKAFVLQSCSWKENATRYARLYEQVIGTTTR